MAIDTGEKRASAGAVGPLPLTFPIPDAAIDSGDRTQMGAIYRGFNEPAPPPGGTIFLKPGKVFGPP